MAQMFKLYGDNGECYTREADSIEELQRLLTHRTNDTFDEWMTVYSDQQVMASVKASSIYRIEPMDK